MFHNIPKPIQERMAHLEALDEQDRSDGTPKLERLRQIPPETGQVLAFLAAGAPRGQVVEVGTSGGYSSLWLLLACRQRGDRLTTFEILENKVRLAQETFTAAQVVGDVDLIHGDATLYLANRLNVAFCFLDVEKHDYDACYDGLVPNLVPGGVLVADNVISHQEELRDFLQKVLADERVDAFILPVGKGLLVCRKI